MLIIILCFPPLKLNDATAGRILGPEQVEKIIREWLQDRGKEWKGLFTFTQALLVHRITASRISAITERADTESRRKQREDCKKFSDALKTIIEVGPNLQCTLKGSAINFPDKDQDEIALNELRKAATYLQRSKHLLPYLGESLDKRSGSHRAEFDLLTAVRSLLKDLKVPAGMGHPKDYGIELSYRLLARDPNKPEQDEKAPSREALVQRFKRRNRSQKK